MSGYDEPRVCGAPNSHPRKTLGEPPSARHSREAPRQRRLQVLRSPLARPMSQFQLSRNFPTGPLVHL